MHIAYCCAGWPPAGAANGVVSYVRAMRDACIAEGHQVSIISNETLYTADGGEHALVPSRHIVERLDAMLLRIDRRRDGRRGHLPGVARWIAAQVRAAHRIAPIDVVEMEESFGWAATVERLARVPVAVRLHGPHFLKPAETTSRDAARRDAERVDAEGHAIRRARAISAPTRVVLDATLCHYQLEDERGSVIPNPVPLAPEAQRWRADACDRDELLFVGRFDFWKGADTAVAAFAQLAAERPRLRLTIVGPDLGIADATGALIGAEAYLAQHVAPDVRARIELAGRIAPERVAERRRTAGLCVLASRTENFPYALFEAFAAGCPVVSTAWHGADALIDDGRTGLLSPVGEPAQLAARIGWMLDHPARAVEMGGAARAQCLSRYTPHRIGRQVTDFYAHALQLGTA